MAMGWLILKTVYFLEDFIETDDWQRLYIRRRCSYVYRTKKDRKTRALWGIIWNHKLYNVIDEVSHKPSSTVFSHQNQVTLLSLPQEEFGQQKYFVIDDRSCEPTKMVFTQCHNVRNMFQ
jgi:hypothetical protein